MMAHIQYNVGNKDNSLTSTDRPGREVPPGRASPAQYSMLIDYSYAMSRGKRRTQIKGTTPAILKDLT
jgi:hypothetical protein